MSFAHSQTICALLPVGMSKISQNLGPLAFSMARFPPRLTTGKGFLNIFLQTAVSCSRLDKYIELHLYQRWANYGLRTKSGPVGLLDPARRRLPYTLALYRRHPHASAASLQTTTPSIRSSYIFVAESRRARQSTSHQTKKSDTKSIECILYSRSQLKTNIAS